MIIRFYKVEGGIGLAGTLVYILCYDHNLMIDDITISYNLMISQCFILKYKLWLGGGSYKYPWWEIFQSIPARAAALEATIFVQFSTLVKHQMEVDTLFQKYRI